MIFIKNQMNAWHFCHKNTMLGVYKNRDFNKVINYFIIMVELRKVQALQGERSLTIVLPKEFAVSLQIRKGDFLKVSVEGRRLILERADVD
jgi:hypothetical protein